MGLTDRQLLWRVELPLALPDIIAGLRIASTSTVGWRRSRCSPAPAASASRSSRSNITFKTGVVAAGGLASLLAFALDVLLLAAQRLLTPWRAARA